MENQERDKYKFMYRKCSCHQASLVRWLSVPEFRAELEKLDAQHIEITDESILPIMEKVYNQKLIERRIARKEGRTIEFPFGYANSGIRNVRKAILAKNPQSSEVADDLTAAQPQSAQSFGNFG